MLSAVAAIIFFSVIIVGCKKENDTNDKYDLMYDNYSLVSKTVIKKVVDYHLMQLENKKQVSKNEIYKIISTSPQINSLKGKPATEKYSSEFKSVIDGFALFLKNQKSIIITSDQYKNFYLKNILSIQNEREREFATEVITMTAAYNIYFSIPENSKRLSKILNSDYFLQFKSKENIMGLYNTGSVGAYIATQVLSFLAGYLMSHILANILPCDPGNSLCTIMRGVIYGLLWALGSHIWMCQEELIPWQFIDGQPNPNINGVCLPVSS